MQSIPKQKLYKTAYFPLFSCYVVITHAYQIDGNWLFYVSNKALGIGKPEISLEGNYIAREHELTDFVL